MRRIDAPERGLATLHNVPRSPEWPRIERLHLAQQPRCVCCTAAMSPDAGVQVHHIFPFNFCIALGRPDLELDLRNLLTLCEDEAGRPGQNHHLLVGHLDCFESANLDVVAAASSKFHGMSTAELRKTASWQSAVGARLKPLSQMTAADRAEFAAKMNARFPKLG